MGEIMFGFMREEVLIWVFMGLFLAGGITVRLMLGLYYRRLIREADNMSATANRQLKQCKLKFVQCYRLNQGVSNVPVFVDKFLNQLAVGWISFRTVYHLSGQLVLLFVVCGGIGVCRRIIAGSTMTEVLPFYIGVLGGLYLYLTVGTLADIRGKRSVLKINLVDYLENHLAARMHVTDQDMQMLYGEEGMEGKAETFLRKEQTGQEKPAKPAAMVKIEPANGQAREKRRGIVTEAAAAGAVDGTVTDTAADAVAGTGFSGTQAKELEELLAEFLM